MLKCHIIRYSNIYLNILRNLLFRKGDLITYSLFKIQLHYQPNYDKNI